MLNIDVKVGKNGWIGDVFAALSISNLALLLVFNRLLYVPESAKFYLPIHTWHHYLSPLILLVLLTAVFLVIIRLIRLKPHTALQFVLLIPIGACFIVIGRALLTILGVSWELLLVFIENIVIIGLVSAVGLWLIFLLRKQITTIIYIALLIFFPFAVLNTVYASVDLAKTVVNPPPTYQKSLAENKAAATPKFIYLLFDELDYRFFFEERMDRVKGVTLENFKSLKETTLFFTDVRDKAKATKFSIPTIVTGSDLKEVKTAPNELYLDEMPWSETDHMFKMFKDAGYKVSIIGYYLPLCRIFNKFTDHCGGFPGRMNPTLKGVVGEQFLSILPRLYLLSYVTEYLESEK